MNRYLMLVANSRNVYRYFFLAALVSPLVWAEMPFSWKPPSSEEPRFPESVMIERSRFVVQPPSLENKDEIVQVLLEKIAERRGGTSAILEVSESRPGTLKLVLSRAQGVIVSSNKYWEMAEILIKVGQPGLAAEPKLNPMKGSQIRKGPVNAESVEYEVVVVVSGSFQAGGMPNDLKGYSYDFEKSGHDKELGIFAQHCLDALVKNFSKPVLIDQKYIFRS